MATEPKDAATTIPDTTKKKKPKKVLTPTPRKRGTNEGLHGAKNEEARDGGGRQKKEAIKTKKLEIECWKYALEAIISVLLYFHIHNYRVYILCYNCYDSGIGGSVENS